MDTKLEKTVQKTIEALARIQRFVVKYGPDISEQQMKQISIQLQKLQKQVKRR